MSTPVRNPNLARGGEIRSRRAALKRAIAAGELDGPAVIDGDVDEWEDVAAGIPVVQLLKAVPGIGDGRAGELMAGFDLRVDVRLYMLGTAGRAALAGAVRKELA